MKLKLFLLSIILSSPGPALAGPYAEYKNEYEMRDWNKTKSVEHMRFGYKAENNLYFEIGPMTSGHSYEAGYKFKFNEVVVKGKLETKDTGEAKTKIETEIRFNF